CARERYSYNSGAAADPKYFDFW
nr:immunoglobulin heavy chain junction region [Macaca mulatta]MOX14595.1 immunoglobulin heavy chain junction region [Macaca mulatta]MOX14605.1 immunoglobulin heavy chain junction region [Macaca mulatta]MOX14765.1 immunoglobulin heavy chain junction region [Macaca mulatta]MOX14966.1 immunoglobulin heavy chain junction region [Macaca mulatta]